MSSPEKSLPPPEPEHHVAQEKPLVNRFIKFLPWTHFVLGPAEVAVALDHSSATAALDGGENFLDGQLYNEETRNIDAGDKKQEIKSSNTLGRLYDKITGDTRAKKRKFTYRMQFGSALAAGGWALYSLTQKNENDSSAMHLAVTAGSLAVAGVTRYVGNKMKKRLKERQDDDPELRKDVDSYYDHAGFDMWSSGVALAGAALYPLGLGVVEKVAGIGLSAYKALRFRPTSNNLRATPGTRDHSGHAEHEHHEHDDCGHFHLSKEASKVGEKFKFVGATALSKTVQSGTNVKNWWQERKTRPTVPRLIAGIASAVMLGGLVTGNITGNSEHNAPSASSITSEGPSSFSADPYIPDVPPYPQHVDIFNCQVAEPGDSQWQMASNQIEQALDRPATEAETYLITLLAAHENRGTTPNPNAIDVGQCVDLPTLPAIQELFYGGDIASGANELLDLSFDDALNRSSQLEDIGSKLRQALAT